MRFSPQSQMPNVPYTKFVVSLTTLPQRMAGLEQCIDSLLGQRYADFEIHLNIPTDRHDAEYRDRYANKHDKLKLFFVDDAGPITKLTYTLQRITDASQWVVTVDDDQIYHADMLSEYNRALSSLPRNTAIGFGGIYPFDRRKFSIRRLKGRREYCWAPHKPTYCGILQGFKSVCYQRGFFSDDFFGEAFWCNLSHEDDVVISSYLGYKNIRKLVIAYSQETGFATRVDSFPNVRPIDNPISGVHIERLKHGASRHTIRAFYKSKNGKYIRR